MFQCGEVCGHALFPGLKLVQGSALFCEMRPCRLKLHILAFNILLLLEALPQSMMRYRAKSKTLDACSHRLQLQALHHSKLATLQGLLQVGELLRDLLALVAEGGELGFHLLQAGLLDLGICQADERALYRLMAFLVIREALKCSIQFPQACQLFSGIGPCREPCIELLQSLQYTHEIIARPRGLIETRMRCGVLL